MYITKACAGCYEMELDPLVSQDDEGRVDPSPSSQHYPFGVDLFQGFVEEGDWAPWVIEVNGSLERSPVNVSCSRAASGP